MSARQATLKPIPDRLVVLTFDDGCKSDVEYVAPLLDEHGFGATFFVNEPHKPYEGWPGAHYLTWDEVRKIHDAGFEIGNHTATHPSVVGLPKAEFVRELECIERRCKEHGVPAPTTFCYPGFHSDRAAAEALAERGYRFARRGVSPEFEDKGEGARGPAYDPAKHHPLLVPTTGFSGPDWGFEDLVWAVDQARGGVNTCSVGEKRGQATECQSPFFAGASRECRAETRDCHSLAVPVSAEYPTEDHRPLLPRRARHRPSVGPHRAGGVREIHDIPR